MNEELVTDYANRRFREVVVPNLDSAFRLARWLAHNKDDAQDIVQEAALRAFRHIGDFAGTKSHAWFLKIVRNTAYTWLAKNRPRSLVLMEDLEALDAIGSKADGCLGERLKETPETALVEAQQGQLLTAAIESLPLPFREALVLREVQGLTYREIAEVLNMPIGTVMSRLARARDQLSSAMQEVRE